MADNFTTRIRSILIGSNYQLIEILGSGTFGKVYLGQRASNGHQVAIKLEHDSINPSLLNEEAQVYKSLAGHRGFPQVYWYGEQDAFRCLVMELLGPNLQDLLQFCGGKFSLKTTLMLADQLLQRFESLHSTGHIHRDIKPENFLLGTGDCGNIVNMTDLGLVTSRVPKNNEFRDTGKTPQNPQLIGTCRFASIRGHFGTAQSWADDLEALGYMLIYFLKGELPWQGLHCRDRHVRYRRVLQIKETTRVEDLCKGLPVAFETYMQYVQDLPFSARPNYTYLRDLFHTLSQQQKFAADQIFDWTLLDFTHHPRPAAGRSKGPKRARLKPKPKAKRQKKARAC